MNEVIEDKEEALSGVVETPTTRVRDFSSAMDLGKWLVLTNPNAIKVQCIKGVGEEFVVFRLYTSS